MKTIALVNQKGGVGKTTSALAISAGLCKAGYKVLRVDADSQCDFSATLRADVKARYTLYELLRGECTTQQAIQRTPYGDAVSASHKLASADIWLTAKAKTSHLLCLQSALKAVSDIYDICVIDVPPALSMLSINALYAADGLIIPVTADSLSYMAFENFMSDTVQSVKQDNKKLTVLGILITQYSNRTNIEKQFRKLFENRAKELGTKVFKTAIRKGIAIRESIALQEADIFQYAPNSNPVIDYAEVIKELEEDL